MNEYVIEQKLRTVSDLCLFDEDGASVPMGIDGLEFERIESIATSANRGCGWIIKGVENSKTYQDALAVFRKKLNRTVPKVAFVSQCYMDYMQESFLIRKVNNNPEDVIFLHYTTGRGAPGLMFMEGEKESYDKLSLENREFFWYMNDCYNAVGYTAKLLLMFAALESLAGKEIKIDENGDEYETYNKENMKLILGKKLFNKIYGKGGLRHKLTHGEYVDASFSGTNYVETLHNLILEYFNKNFDTKIDIVTNPQRHPFGVAYYKNAFIKPSTEDIDLSLKNILQEMNKADKSNNDSMDNFVFAHSVENY